MSMIPKLFGQQTDAPIKLSESGTADADSIDKAESGLPVATKAELKRDVSERLKDVDRKTWLFAGFVFWGMVFVALGSTIAVIVSQKKSSGKKEQERHAYKHWDLVVERPVWTVKEIEFYASNDCTGEALPVRPGKIRDSGHHGEFSSDRAFDGDFATHWSGFNETEGYDVSIGVDFDKPTAIGCIALLADAEGVVVRARNEGSEVVWTQTRASDPEIPLTKLRLDEMDLFVAPLSVAVEETPPPTVAPINSCAIGPQPTSCDCDYSSGGCQISSVAPSGKACNCVYEGFWTCSGEITSCSDPSSQDCVCPSKSKAACLQGRGDCDGYPDDEDSSDDGSGKCPDDHLDIKARLQDVFGAENCMERAGGGENVFVLDCSVSIQGWFSSDVMYTSQGYRGSMRRPQELEIFDTLDYGSSMAVFLTFAGPEEGDCFFGNQELNAVLRDIKQRVDNPDENPYIPSTWPSSDYHSDYPHYSYNSDFPSYFG